MQENIQLIEITVTPEEAASDIFIKQLIASTTKLEDFEFQIVRRSIDARKKQVKFNLKLKFIPIKNPLFFKQKKLFQ